MAQNMTKRGKSTVKTEPKVEVEDKPKETEESK